jgi:hypothetical protein
MLFADGMLSAENWKMNVDSISIKFFNFVALCCGFHLRKPLSISKNVVRKISTIQSVLKKFFSCMFANHSLLSRSPRCMSRAGMSVKTDTLLPPAGKVLMLIHTYREVFWEK